MPVSAPGGHHRNLDLVDQCVELLEVGLHQFVSVRMARASGQMSMTRAGLCDGERRTISGVPGAPEMVQSASS
jgi:hypothetical protein